MTADSPKMSSEEFRQAMYKYWDEINKEGKAFKDPYIRLDRLRSLLKKLDADERNLANEVLAEWLLSDNAGRRYDANVLIRELNITTALPALEELIRRLSKSAVPDDHMGADRLRKLATQLMEHQRRSGAA